MSEDNQANQTNQKPEHLNTKTTENTLRGVIIALIVCMILSVLGVGFGIYGSIQANNALGQLNGDLIEEDEDVDFGDSDEETYNFGKPENVDEISYISISYNNNEDFIEISSGEEDDDQYIYYYAYDNSGEETGDIEEVNTKEITKYIFDNDLQYLGENDPLENETWSIEVDSVAGYSYISGESTPPEWFNALLKQLDVDNKGYKSKATE